MWLQGRNFINICEKVYSSRHCIAEWRQRFANWNLTSSNYTRKHFTASIVTYARVSMLRNQCYIGMTTVTFKKRERARQRKLRSVQRGRLANCEPAVRWWASTKSYFSFLPVLLHRLPTKLAASIQEAALIQSLQPSLNDPWIKSIFNKNAVGKTCKFALPKSKRSIGYRNLWK